MKKITLITSLFLSASLASAQCVLLQDISLQERVQKADVVFEGKVLGAKSFWNHAHNYIYTASTVEIYKVFKGEPGTDKVEMITEGGVVGERGLLVNPVLKLSEGQTGIFFGSALNADLPVSGNLFKPYSGVSGFIEYDLIENIAADVFDTYSGITKNLYTKITALTGKKYNVVHEFDVDRLIEEHNNSRSAPPVISNFSPTIVAAGMGQVLTINGSNFGATQGSGYVSFKNADNGGSTYVNVTVQAYYVSWSNTSIQIIVPGNWAANAVGTGTIRVTNNTVETGTSSSPLTVSYNRQEIVYFGLPTPIYLFGLDANGGYIMTPSNDFAAIPAADSAFVRAQRTWNCADHIRWGLSSTPSSVDTSVIDGINLVRYAYDPEMGGALGIGGVAVIYTPDMSGTYDYWAVVEMDVRYKASVNWNYNVSNPAPGQSDFESVTLHEIGHTHLFSHTIDNQNVMHYALTTGQTRRVLLYSNVLGGNDVISNCQSIAASTGFTPMNLFYNPSCPVGIDESAQDISSLPVYPNPSSETIRLNIPRLLNAGSYVEVFNSIGEKFSAKLIADNTVDISHLDNGIYFLRISDTGTSSSYKFNISR